MHIAIAIMGTYAISQIMYMILLVTFYKKAISQGYKVNIKQLKLVLQHYYQSQSNQIKKQIFLPISNIIMATKYSEEYLNHEDEIIEASYKKGICSKEEIIIPPKKRITVPTKKIFENNVQQYINQAKDKHDLEKLKQLLEQYIKASDNEKTEMALAIIKEQNRLNWKSEVSPIKKRVKSNGN